MQAVHTLFDWWHQMAAMHHKYGSPPDIEDKPEWAEVQRLQRQMLREMHEHTGTPETILFETIQRAILKLLGRGPRALTRDEAQAVVAEAIRMGLRDETLAAQTSRVRN